MQECMLKNKSVLLELILWPSFGKPCWGHFDVDSENATPKRLRINSTFVESPAGFPEVGKRLALEKCGLTYKHTFLSLE
jgi:hypothetical protein